jgi:membrane-associated phospholipid phosphatase
MKRNKSLSLLRSVSVFIVLSLVFALLLMSIRAFTAKGEVILYLAQLRNPVLNELFLWITRMGEGSIIIATLLIFLFISYRKSALFSLVGVLSLLLSFLAKSLFSQPRPLAYFTSLDQAELMGEIDGYAFYSGLTSMPSGHTLAAFSFFFIIAFIAKKTIYQILAFTAAGLVGISRIYLGQHFILDVAVGTLLGLLIAIFSIYLVYVVWEDKKALDASLSKPN